MRDPLGNRAGHILLNHLEFSYADLHTVLDAVGNPEYILAGPGGSLVAVVVLGRDSYLHVYYQEKRDMTDGFIITARIRPEMNKRLVTWRR
jgi:hypothetical protein